jgi:hypothetical protein
MVTKAVIPSAGRWGLPRVSEIITTRWKMLRAAVAPSATSALGLTIARARSSHQRQRSIS